MNTGFFDKINVRLTIQPIMAVILVLAGGVSAFLFMGPSYLLKDYHKLHLLNITSEKKLAVDAWLEYYRRDLAGLSRLGLFRDTLDVLLPREDEKTIKAPKKNRLAAARQDAKPILAGLLTERVRSGKYNMIAVLSTDGRVLASSKQEVEGADWSDKNFFKKTGKAPKSTAVIRIGNEAGTNCSIEMVTPLTGDNNTTNGIIYSLSEAKDLAGILKVEKGIYRTEKIELIDSDGNVLLTKDGVPAQKTKYNVPATAKDGAVSYKGGVFFYFLELDDSPFRIIGTVEGTEVMAPLNFLLVLSSACAGLIVLILVFQAVSIAPRVVTGPIEKLREAVKAAMEGGPETDLGQDHKGEMLQLRDAIETLIRSKNIEQKDSGLEPEEFDMPPLMKAIEAGSKKLVGTKEIEMIVDYDDALKNRHLRTDRQKLLKAVCILADNAVKCTDVGTVTIIASGITKDQVDYVEISVADTGRGFSPEVAAGLFNETTCPIDFLQLATAGSMAGSLGGKLAVESIEGKGSVFTLTVPMRPEFS